MDADAMFGQRKGGKLPGPRGEPKPELGTEDTDSAAAAERSETILWVRGQIGAATPLAGTPGERYLVDHRGLREPSWPASIRWSGQLSVETGSDLSPLPARHSDQRVG